MVAIRDKISFLCRLKSVECGSGIVYRIIESPILLNDKKRKQNNNSGIDNNNILYMFYWEK